MVDEQHKVEIISNWGNHTLYFSSKKRALDYRELMKGWETTKYPSIPLTIWIERFKEEILPQMKSHKTYLYQLKYWEEKLGDCIAINISPQ